MIDVPDRGPRYEPEPDDIDPYAEPNEDDAYEAERQSIIDDEIRHQKQRLEAANDDLYHEIIDAAYKLPEYRRKQLAMVIIGSTLTPMARGEVHSKLTGKEVGDELISVLLDIGGRK